MVSCNAFKRFTNLKLVADRILFCKDDGLEVIQGDTPGGRMWCSLLIPYTAGGKRAGKRLYRHFTLDHERLFTLCESVKGDFLMTYDNADEVKMMARNHGFQMRLTYSDDKHSSRNNARACDRERPIMDGSLHRST